MSTRPRNLDLEREITHQACRGFADPTALIVHAETRALRLSGEYVDDAMLVRSDRDRPTDVREELADARNHLVWWIEDNTDHPTIDAKLGALRFIGLAYQALQDDD